MALFLPFQPQNTEIIVIALSQAKMKNLFNNFTSFAKFYKFYYVSTGNLINHKFLSFSSSKSRNFKTRDSSSGFEYTVSGNAHRNYLYASVSRGKT